MADNESDGGFRETRTSGASSGLPESAAAPPSINRLGDFEISEDLFLMAMIDWNLGDRASARSYYDRAVARLEATFPDNPATLMLQEDARGVLGL